MDGRIDKEETAFLIILVGIGIAAAWTARDFPFAPRLLPMMGAVSLIGFVLARFIQKRKPVTQARTRVGGHGTASSHETSSVYEEPPEFAQWRSFAWLGVLSTTVIITGLLVGGFIFTVLFMWLHGKASIKEIVSVLTISLGGVWLLVQFLSAPLYRGLF